MANENKVQFNLKNVHYAVLTEAKTGGATTYSWGTPVAVPGAVNLNLEQQGEITKSYADGVVYYTCPAIEAALYTAEKDTALEAAVDTVLQSAEIAYTKTEGWVEDERVYAIIYEFEV